MITAVRDWESQPLSASLSFSLSHVGSWLDHDEMQSDVNNLVSLLFSMLSIFVWCSLSVAMVESLKKKIKISESSWDLVCTWKSWLTGRWSIAMPVTATVPSFKRAISSSRSTRLRPKGSVWKRLVNSWRIQRISCNWRSAEIRPFRRPISWEPLAEDICIRLDPRPDRRPAVLLNRLTAESRMAPVASVRVKAVPAPVLISPITPTDPIIATRTCTSSRLHAVEASITAIRSLRNRLCHRIRLVVVVSAAVPLTTTTTRRRIKVICLVWPVDRVDLWWTSRFLNSIITNSSSNSSSIIWTGTLKARTLRHALRRHVAMITTVLDELTKLRSRSNHHRRKTCFFLLFLFVYFLLSFFFNITNVDVRVLGFGYSRRNSLIFKKRFFFFFVTPERKNK